VATGETWACAVCGGENPSGMRFCGHCGAPVAETPTAAEPAVDDPEVTSALRSFVTGRVADRLVETGGHLPEERRLVTALFADVSGFTSLADRLDPEQLIEVIDPVITTLSDIVGRYDGYVEKYAGDALLALFGAPVSHEDDAARALLVALEMHRELKRVCGELPYDPQLTLHVGVNSGHAIARILGSEARLDYGVLGDSIILAQRLESVAPPNETYVSDLTYRLTENTFEFEPLGEMTLKGKSEPVHAWRLVGERATPASLRSSLVGRDRELAMLEEILAELGDGQGAVVALTGEAGVGKSRLMDAMRQHAEALGIRWLNARCLSYGAELAYWPLIDLLRRTADLRSDIDSSEAALRLQILLRAVPGAVPYFARLLSVSTPEGDDVAALEPEAFRRGLHYAFASWLRAIAAETPVVLELEDVHWADNSTIALVTELARVCESDRAALCLIGRPESEELATSIGGERSVTLRLEALDAAGIHSFLQSLLGDEIPRGLEEFVTDRSAGNPFFAQELVRSLQDEEALVPADGGWGMRAGWDARSLPATIEEVLAARFDALPRPAAALLQTVSVIGRRVRLPLLEAVEERPAEIGPALDQLLESGLLEHRRDDGEDVVMFHHALVQDAAYSRLLRRQRRALHLRVAEVAESLYGAGDETIDLLARHLYLGEAGEKAAEYLVRAGARARRLFANAEAILHYGRAVEVARGDVTLAGRLPAMLLELADLHELIGDYDAALRLYTDIRDETQDVRAWRGLASTLRKRGEFMEALGVVDEAFATEALAGRDLRPLWLERGWTLSVMGRYEEGVEAFEAGLIIDEENDDEVTGQLLLQTARAETLLGEHEAALEHALGAERIFTRRDDPRGLASTLRIIGDAHRDAGRPDEAAHALRRGLALAERVGSAEEIGACLINLGLAEMERGELAEAIACDRRAIEEFERIGHATGRAIGSANLAEKLALQENYEEALEQCAKALELSRAIGNSVTVADALRTASRIRLEQGEFADAAAQAEEAAKLFREMGITRWEAESLELAASALEQNGEGERADTLRAEARSLA
jgi:class 3 adenylate cyclase/tetratricopeptide (TPR) repeat protein